MLRRHFVTSLALLGLATAGLAAPAAAQDKTITIFAAASMKNALDDIGAAFTKQSGVKVVASYAASSALIKQIEQGAPADVFASADLDWMDYGTQKKLVQDATRVNLLGNSLVLIAPKESKLTAKIAPAFPLAALIGEGHLAMANTDSVPAGKYGKAALTKLGVWDQVSGKIAQAENVRAALTLVSRGEAPLGIVYATDARSDPNVKVLDIFPEDTHPPIIYPVAETVGSTNKDAGAFLAFLKSSAARGVFEAQGFRVLSTP